MIRASRLLSAAAIAALVSLPSVPARAQAVVIDPVLIARAITEFNQLLIQYRVLFCSYQQQQQIGLAVQHDNPNIMAVAPGLQANAMRLPGSAANQMPGLNYGENLSGAGQQFYDQNHYYTPVGNDFNALEMQRNQIATANLQGEAQTGMKTIGDRMTSLEQLEASIQTQPDVTSVGAINARIAAEKMYLANETIRAQHLAMLQQTQKNVAQQRYEEHNRKLQEEYQAAVNAQAGW